MPGAGGLGLHSILVDEANHDRMWVAISSAGVFRTEDGGTTWDKIDDGVAPDVVEVEDADATQGVTRFESWCPHGLAADPNDANVIYRQDHFGMHVTRDGGANWELLESGLPIVELSSGRRCVFGFAIALDPRTGTVLSLPLGGDNARYPVDGRLRVYRTHVGDESWEEHAGGLPDNCYSNILRGAIGTDGLDPCGIYLGTTGGTVYASNDVGESWATLPGSWPRILSVNAYTL
jgi:photosystem II stability/assembly factor-like uncharacterized protein